MAKRCYNFRSLAKKWVKFRACVKFSGRRRAGSCAIFFVFLSRRQRTFLGLRFLLFPRCYDSEHGGQFTIGLAPMKFHEEPEEICSC